MNAFDDIEKAIEDFRKVLRRHACHHHESRRSNDRRVGSVSKDGWRVQGSTGLASNGLQLGVADEESRRQAMSDTPWYIIKCRPCAEFKARDALHLDHTIAAYVPVEFSTSRFGNGRETIRKAPVVRGYLFAAVADHDWAVIRGMREITGAVFVDGRPARLTQRQVDAIELLSRPLDRANASGWSPGDRVRVRRGAFAELHVVIAEIERGTVIGTTEMFGKVHTVRLRSEDLEAA